MIKSCENCGAIHIGSRGMECHTCDRVTLSSWKPKEKYSEEKDLVSEIDKILYTNIYERVSSTDGESYTYVEYDDIVKEFISLIQSREKLLIEKIKTHFINYEDRDKIEQALAELSKEKGEK